MLLSVIGVFLMLRNLEHVIKEPDPVQMAEPIGREIEAVIELQNRLNNLTLWNSHAREAPTMLRWLRFNKLNVSKAESGLRAHIKWRKENDIDRLRVSPPNPDMWKRFWFNVTGFARNGDPVILIPFGDWDIRNYTDTVDNQGKFEQYTGQIWEKGLYAVEHVELSLMNARKDAVGYILVCDLQNLKYRQLANFKTMKYILAMVTNFENNYPAAINKAFMINSNWVFDALITLIRPFIKGSTQKIKLLSKEREKWEKAIRRYIDPTILPYRYGGYSKKERRHLNFESRPGDH